MTSQGWNEPRAPGARRQKVLGYIKAANELRQTYQTQLSTKLANQDYDGGIPGAFPEADIVRSGDEEMLLFPSYARKHIKIKHHNRSSGVLTPGAHEAIDNPDGGDAEYWRREWEKYEDANAIVDVDVRGWIYSPQKGPLNRRNRLIVAVARRLSGIPAPDASPTPSRDSSQRPAFREKLHDSMMSHEEEAAAREAEMIARRGQREAEAASRGTYSSETGSMKNYSPTGSRSSSPSRPDSIRSNDASDMAANDETNPRPLQQRQTWNSSTNMSREELLAANEQLMGRLRPFMTMPLANTPITIFFFNESKSQSKSVYTDESGHFKVRAALDFIPEKVRVLASENLSATEDVFITDSNGISLISDIDDTIKHSAIASGAREIFKNTFLRELGDLTIQGVKEWYSKVASMGVQLHYVSNSPWQLYPLLRSYFSLAGLPSGSFHLKQYSGMLQGIFEPAAERKKGSLDRIMADFPERKFILVGDSGEADLEVYTDIVMEHPGRILAVFIRDVTSPDHSKVSSSSLSHSPDSIEPMWADNPDRRPALPVRPKPTQSAESQEFLIDFSEEPVSALDEKQKSPSYSNDLHQLQQTEQGSSPQVPNKPAKPSNLRSFSTSSQQASQQDVVSSGQTTTTKSKPPPPPKPRRPSSAVSSAMSDGSLVPQAPSKPVSVEMPQRTGRPQFSNRTSSYNSHSSAFHDEGYVASARRQLASAYNSLPAIRPQSPTRNGSYNDGRPPSPRRGLSSYPAAAARWVTGASEGDPAAGGDGGAPGAPYDKKLEMWKRRWARAEDVMRRNGVYLRTWRVGSDVMDDCIKLIEKAQRNLERK